MPLIALIKGVFVCFWMARLRRGRPPQLPPSWSPFSRGLVRRQPCLLLTNLETRMFPPDESALKATGGSPRRLHPTNSWPAAPPRSRRSWRGAWRPIGDPNSPNKRSVKLHVRSEIRDHGLHRADRPRCLNRCRTSAVLSGSPNPQVRLIRVDRGHTSVADPASRQPRHRMFVRTE
jgi:hypothetical protein